MTEALSGLLDSDIGKDRFSTQTLDAHPQGESVKRVLAAALAAVEPGAAVRQNLQREGKRLVVGDREYDLDAVERVLLAGFGKAAAPMGQAAAGVLGDHLTAGLLITKYGHADAPPGGFDSRLEIQEAGHPVPDERSLGASQKMIAFLSELSSSDLVIGLVSGGGSALLTSPAPGISLADLGELTAALLGCGATINEINSLRKHLETLKGGGLARQAHPARLAVLALSDVIGDPLDVIASGPAVPDPTTYQDALAVLARYAITADVPEAVLKRLQAGQGGEIPDTPKPEDPIFERVTNTVIGSNRQAAAAAIRQAGVEGMQAQLLTTYLQGEASQTGRFLAAVGRQLVTGPGFLRPPGCLVVGGETTVTLRGDGKGGRNQEMALGAVEDLDGLESVLLVTLATDGGDGPTDAAGAVVSGETLAQARKLGLRPHDFLQRSDSYHFFEPLGDLLVTGPTQTNVNDLAFLFLFEDDDS